MCTKNWKNIYTLKSLVIYLHYYMHTKTTGGLNFDFSIVPTYKNLFGSQYDGIGTYWYLMFI